MAADLTRSLAGGRPWLLMEHSTGAVNWQPRNIAKRPGEMARNSLAHVARGADAVLFFQWRARGAARRSSTPRCCRTPAPHPDLARGRRARRRPARLAEVRGSRVAAEVAVLWDWESFWAQDLEWRPSVDLATASGSRRTTGALARRAHRRLRAPGATTCRRTGWWWRRAYLSREAARTSTTSSSAAGTCSCRTSPASSTRTTPCTRGPPGRARATARPDVEEFLPLRPANRADDSLAGAGATRPTVPTVGRPTVARARRRGAALFPDGPAAGQPAVTRPLLRRGPAWYVATRPDPDRLCDLSGRSGRRRPGRWTPRRRSRDGHPSGDQSFRVGINHADHDLRRGRATRSSPPPPGRSRARRGRSRAPRTHRPEEDAHHEAPSRTEPEARAGPSTCSVPAVLAAPCCRHRPSPPQTGRPPGGRRRDVAGPRVRGADLPFTLQLEKAGVSSDGRARAHRADLPGRRHELGPSAGLGRPTPRLQHPHTALVLAAPSQAVGRRCCWTCTTPTSGPTRAPTDAGRLGGPGPRPAGRDRTRLHRHSSSDFPRRRPVDMVQIGNEITAGMLWPLGQLYHRRAELARLHQAAEGRHRRCPRGAGPGPAAGDGAHRPRRRQRGARWFFDHVLARASTPT